VQSIEGSHLFRGATRCSDCMATFGLYRRPEELIDDELCIALLEFGTPHVLVSYELQQRGHEHVGRYVSSVWS
jgi:hypothetical protein